MVLLLDTHILLWALVMPERLPQDVRSALANPDNEVCFSAVSIWEIAVKTALKRLDFRYNPDEIANAARQTGMVEICVSASQAARVVDLPHHHNDPFDRYCQVNENLPILTTRCGVSIGMLTQHVVVGSMHFALT